MENNIQQIPHKKKSKFIWSLLFLLVNVIIILIIGLKEMKGSNMVSFKEVLAIWKENYIYLITGIGAFACAIIIEIVSMIILIYSETKKIKIGLAARVAILGRYYDFITPLGSGGQGFQIYYLVKGKVSGSGSSAIVFIHFFMNQLAFLTIAVLSMIFFFPLIDGLETGFAPTTLKIMIIFGAIFAFLGPLIFLFFSVFPKLSEKITSGVLTLLAKIKIIKNPADKKEKVNSFIDNYFSSLKHFSKRTFTLIASFICSCIYQIAIASIMYFVVRSCGVTSFSFLEVFAISMFTYCAVSFIPTPGNSGAAEIMFTSMFASLTTTVSFWGMILWRINCYYLFLVLGLVFLVIQFIKSARKKEPQITDDIVLQNDTNDDIE